MRKPHLSSGISGKGLKAGILLAHDTQRRNRPGQEMQDLPGARQDLTPPIGALDVSHKPLTFPTMGLDILGPLPLGKGQCKFIIVAVDYFTKWAEAEPLATITEQKIRNFVWRAIICRFGIPRALVSDNGKQFDNSKFRDFCAELGIKNYYSSPAHPQFNGQAEVTIRTLKAALKTKLEDLKGKWVEYLPEVLWVYRTTQKSATRETPFALAFGMEAVAPVEVGLKSPRIELAAMEHNDEAVRLNLDLLDEKRDQVLRRTEDYQRKTARYYNQKVKPRSYMPGDLVLKKLRPARKNPTHGKLGPNWEGPDIISRVVRPGNYELQIEEGKFLQHTWNAEHLKYSTSKHRFVALNKALLIIR